MSSNISRLEDDICFICHEWCSTKANCSDRYMCLQGNYTDCSDDDEIECLYVCDKCFDEYEFEDNDEIGINNKIFKIDSFHRMND